MRILLIEDEYKLAQAVKRGLELQSYAVDVESDGEDALSSALSGEYDLIVLDRMLPNGVDGLDICRKVREQKVETPILMLTAKDKVGDRVAGLNAGADDYLIKPFAFEELSARVRALLRRPTDTLDPVLRVADLELNPNTYVVKRAGRAIDLSKTEYGLLEYLMRNPDRILTKDAITSHVWNYDADILPNTVEVYMSYLRRKIDKPFSGPELIHTARGFGYKLGSAQ
jgi:DNA-binding response OmpR family regulator